MSKIEDLFNENINYCEYVYEKNYEYSLGLDSYHIQNIANMYVSELESKGIDYESSLVEDDKLLLDLVQEYISDFEDVDDEYDIKDTLIDIKLRHEKMVNSMGGYAYNDSYDDISPEIRNAEIALRFSKKIK